MNRTLKGLIVMEGVKTGYTVEYVIGCHQSLIDTIKRNPEILKNPECYPGLKNLAMLRRLISASYSRINGAYEGQDLIFVTDRSKLEHLDAVFTNIEERATERLNAVGVFRRSPETAIGAIARYVECGAIIDSNLETVAELIIEYTSLFKLFVGVSSAMIFKPQAGVDLFGNNIASTIRSIRSQPQYIQAPRLA